MTFLMYPTAEHAHMNSHINHYRINMVLEIKKQEWLNKCLNSLNWGRKFSIWVEHCLFGAQET